MAQTCGDLAEAVGRDDLAGRLAGLRERISSVVRVHDGGSEHEEEVTRCAKAVSDAAWERLTHGGWDHVCWREAFVFAQLFMAHALVVALDSRHSLRTQHSASLCAVKRPCLC